ncbi:unnamed protein product (macronuclear) [Paramecium tetraurelia]|uniref:Uncharacterized protein n=1 Tax=Paramecium tetraurelia TaxID=5888 RepID=A0CTM4_PARTE|nr:uncharacterized protein GSPATT00010375001 [Paramecium tetraurelia]CAK74141.1 unnamed protein product [Paramecium tetraurelia]|eukprot:XP_001441538.1 hypothetical protein (macronuclear) [Paramecium tetraurelia strain d4-2]
MDLQHTKSYAALNQQNCQLFKPKALSVRQQMAQIPMQTPRVQIKGLTTPKKIEDASNPQSDQQLYSFKSYRISTEIINGSPLDQIQLILRENEKLKRTLNQKQHIIETLTTTRKVKPRFDFNDFKTNSRSLVQPQSQQESIKPKNIEVKQSISQNYNKRIKLPKIEDSIPNNEDECNFTFANNFFNNNTCKNQKINFKQVFTQSHLKKKFFT